MDILYETVAGLDVHQKTVVACVRKRQLQGKLSEEVQTFGTMTGDLLRLSDWLLKEGVTHVTEAAWAASRTKNTYLGAAYRRLAPRRGKKRALVAIGHTLLVIVYRILTSNDFYQDLGVDYFDKLKPEQYRRYLVKRLESLGFNVELKPKDSAA